MNYLDHKKSYIFPVKIDCFSCPGNQRVILRFISFKFTIDKLKCDFKREVVVCSYDEEGGSAESLAHVPSLFTACANPVVQAARWLVVEALALTRHQDGNFQGLLHRRHFLGVGQPPEAHHQSPPSDQVGRGTGQNARRLRID